MRIDIMRSKLHRITITEADLNYIGSITLDPDLIEAADLVIGEKVQICLLYTSPSPRDRQKSRMPSSA